MKISSTSAVHLVSYTLFARQVSCILLLPPSIVLFCNGFRWLDGPTRSARPSSTQPASGHAWLLARERQRGRLLRELGGAVGPVAQLVALRAPQGHDAAVGQRQRVEVVAQRLILRTTAEVRELRPERRARLAERVRGADAQQRDEPAHVVDDETV